MQGIVDSTPPWMKLAALIILGGVAKELMSPRVINIDPPEEKVDSPKPLTVV